MGTDGERRGGEEGREGRTPRWRAGVEKAERWNKKVRRGQKRDKKGGEEQKRAAKNRKRCSECREEEEGEEWRWIGRAGRTSHAVVAGCPLWDTGCPCPGYRGHCLHSAHLALTFSSWQTCRLRGGKAHWVADKSVCRQTGERQCDRFVGMHNTLQRMQTFKSRSQIYSKIFLKAN